MVNKKSAPQRDVIEISRVGEWGKLTYSHRLSCGHTEVRKRPAKTPKIACTWCVIAEEKVRELRTLTIVPPPVTEEVWDFYDDTVVDEVTIAQLRSDLASALGCTNDDIEIISSVEENGRLHINYVTVILDYATAQKISKKQQNHIDI